MREREDQGCRIEDRISGKTDAPKSAVINPRDDDLTCCKFEKLSPRALTVGWDQAFRDEFDLHAFAVGGICDGIIVAHGPAPGTKDIQPLEGLTIYPSIRPRRNFDRARQERLAMKHSTPNALASAGSRA